MNSMYKYIGYILVVPRIYYHYCCRQLSKEAIVVNEHAVSVLQTLVDRCPNLATDSVNYFHSVLTATSQELSTSAKFGKLLMGVLTKYGEKVRYTISDITF